MTDISDLIQPSAPKTFVVGVEDDDDGSVRMYVGARSMNLHTHVDDAQSVADLRAAWASGRHVIVNVPRMDELCGCRQDIEPIPVLPPIPAGDVPMSVEPACGALVTVWPEEEGLLLTCTRPAGHDHGLPEDARPHEDGDGNRWWGADPDTVVWA